MPDSFLVTRVSLLSIAQAAGCSTATVSRALRDHPRLPRETCRRIQELAREMGYTPDARLSELMVHLKKQHQHWDRPIIACVGGFSPETARDPQSLPGGYLLGAAQQAATMGYDLRCFSLHHPELTPKRLSRMLYSRGITGLFVGAMQFPDVRLEMEWEHFTPVALGHSLAWPVLHRVSNHQYHSMRTCFRNTLALGYRRVGLAMLPRVDARADYSLTAGVLIEQLQLPEEDRLPILKLEATEGEVFRRWFEAHRPDVVIYAGNPIRIGEWLREMKLEVPRDIGLVNAGLHDTSLGMTGMLHNLEEVGAAAIDLLISQMHKNERGIPEKPLSLLLEGTWVEGATTLRRHAGLS